MTSSQKCANCGKTKEEHLGENKEFCYFRDRKDLNKITMFVPQEEPKGCGRLLQWNGLAGQHVYCGLKNRKEIMLCPSCKSKSEEPKGCGRLMNDYGLKCGQKRFKNICLCPSCKRLGKPEPISTDVEKSRCKTHEDKQKFGKIDEKSSDSLNSKSHQLTENDLSKIVPTLEEIKKGLSKSKTSSIKGTPGLIEGLSVTQETQTDTSKSSDKVGQSPTNLSQVKDIGRGKK